MTHLATYLCNCRKSWSVEQPVLLAEHCPECGHYPVFPSEQERVGEGAGEPHGASGHAEEADELLRQCTDPLHEGDDAQWLECEGEDSDAADPEET